MGNTTKSTKPRSGAKRKSTKDAPTDAKADAEADAPTDAKADAGAPDAPTDAPTDAPKADAKADAKADTDKAPEAPTDPLIKLEAERAEAEASLKETFEEAKSAADPKAMLALSKRMGDLEAQVSALSKQIADTGFSRRVEEAVRSFMEGISESDIPEGNVHLQIIIEDRVLIGVKAVGYGSANKAKPKKGKSKAALRSSDRDPRLPPAGLTLPSMGGDERGPCHVTYTEGSDVIVSGPCADGTVLRNETFSSVSAAGKRVTGNSVNGYVWAQLGSPAHKRAGGWVGHQVDAKGNPIKG